MSNEQDVNHTPADIEVAAPQVEENTAPETTEATQSNPQETPEEAERRKHSGSGFKKRIDKMGAKIADLERQLQESRQAAPPTPQRDPSQKPKADDFDDYDAYESAVESWRIRQARESLKAEMEAEKQREQAAAQARSWEEKVNKTREKVPDLDDLMDNLVDEGIQLPPYASEFVLDSDFGVDVLVSLAKNTDEAKRILSLSPVKVLRELTKLELSLSGNQPQAEKPRASSTPAPPRPLNPQGSPISKRLSDASDYEEYQRLRRAGVHE